MNKFIIVGAVLTLGVVGLAMWAFWPEPPAPAVVPPTSTADPVDPIATSTQLMIGMSVEARPIEVYTFGTGETNLLFVGGIHGGYEANTVRLAQAMIEEFQLDISMIPESVTVHIIPNLNPDGYALPTTASAQARRFNANNIDLNRNFDCRWQPESTWRSAVVSAGLTPFSEPEAITLRDYVRTVNPNAAVFWHSTGNAVFTSECGNGILDATEVLMNTYASAANYEAAGLWTAYPVTGDAEGWLASIGIPAVTVELETREGIEWERNWAGVLATLELYR
jgi:predicted deacylase